AQAAPAPATPPTDPLDACARLGGLTEFVSAVRAAGLESVLMSGAPLTVLAPSDRAFARLKERDRASLLIPENQPALRAVVAQHLVRGRFTLTELQALGSVPTLSGQRVAFTTVGSATVADGADLIRADVELPGGGVVHVIDAVLFPNTRGALDTLRWLGGHERLLDLIDEAGLEEEFASGAMTLFAPTDAAFKALPDEILEALDDGSNRSVLVDLLSRHMVAGALPAAELERLSPLAALAGGRLTVRRDGAALVIESESGVGSVPITRADIDGPGGFIHRIDRLLLPRDGLRVVPDGRLVVGVFTEPVGKALAAQLKIEQRGSFLVERLTRNGPAQRAGLKVNDVVVSIDGIPATSDNLDLLKARKGYGGTIEFVVLRAGERLTILVPVGVE
ncbi:MAG TPA: hypothetical protein DEB06_01400, partial [Phycisphaerales bacterium]|nr:hypothetical protein [Phycisphaerales bacterium]